MSTMVMAADRPPAAVGVNVTMIVQGGAPAAMVPPHVLLTSAKSPALVPVMVTLVTVSKALPVFVNWTDCEELEVLMGWSANVRLSGDRVTIGAGRPFPARGTDCGLLAALSVMFSVP